MATWIAAGFREFRGEEAVGRGWLELARALLAPRRGKTAEAEALAARAVLERLGAGRDLELIDALLRGATDGTVDGLVSDSLGRRRSFGLAG